MFWAQALGWALRLYSWALPYVNRISNLRLGVILRQPVVKYERLNIPQTSMRSAPTVGTCEEGAPQPLSAHVKEERLNGWYTNTPTDE